MNPPGFDAERWAKRFAEMLAKPPLLPDPVFPKLNYLAVFGRSYFSMVLNQVGQPKLVSTIRVNGSSPQQVMFTTGRMAFWAFDFEAVSDQGLSGRDEFLERVKELIRRPPANMAAFTMEQHIVARGVLNIQIPEESGAVNEYKFAGSRPLAGMLPNWFHRKFEIEKGKSRWIPGCSPMRH